MGKFIDLTGQRFGRLVALYRAENKKKQTMWACKCDCGNTCTVSAGALKSCHTLSCGCLQRENTSNKNKKDITGLHINHIFVEGFYKVLYRRRSYYNCICDCGKRFIASRDDIVGEHIKSCGCLVSKGEELINTFLSNNNIRFIRQKRFIQCKSILLLPFDFYLPDYNIAIEYDGEFHYRQYKSYGDKLNNQQIRDSIKTNYCEENDIVLLRIPYWEKDNIESILSDWLFLKDAEEANSSDVDLSA